MPDPTDITAYDFALPEDRIAQTPADRRDEARLMVVDRRTHRVHHHRFRDLPEVLSSNGPVSFIRNAVAVFKARLRGRRPTGGQVECLLLRPGSDFSLWWCLLRPGNKLRPGAEFHIEPGVRATVEAVEPADGESLVRFHGLPEGGVMELADCRGEVPLPPYIRRGRAHPLAGMDEERYQTIYADLREKGAVAAPTAGLHFTVDLLSRLEAAGHAFHDLFLDIGAGTFRPIQTQDLRQHTMHSESYRIPPSTVASILRPPGPLFAVGTTSLRAIESFHRTSWPSTALSSGSSICGVASLFIFPPAHFQVDGLITNFHLPRSTLLCLVAAFLEPGGTGGIAWLKELYAEALALDYRFFSYGDAMLIR